MGKFIVIGYDENGIKYGITKSGMRILLPARNKKAKKIITGLRKKTKN